MQSALFRQETGRRLRTVSHLVWTEYLHGRYQWMSAFQDPDPRILEEQIGTLAKAVERGRVTGYRRFISASSHTFLTGGGRPIVLLAAADVFEQAVLHCLTPDQQNVLEPFLVAGREQRQIVLRDWLQRVEAAGA